MDADAIMSLVDNDPVVVKADDDKPVFDFDKAVQDVFFAVPAQAKPNAVLTESADAYAEAVVVEGVTSSDSIVQVTGGPRIVEFQFDTTQFPDGLKVAAGLFLSFDGGNLWERAVSIGVNERGKEKDGTPSNSSGGRYMQAFPLADCLAKVILIVKGGEIATSSKIWW